MWLIMLSLNFNSLQNRSLGCSCVRLSRFAWRPQEQLQGRLQTFYITRICHSQYIFWRSLLQKAPVCGVLCVEIHSCLIIKTSLIFAQSFTRSLSKAELSLYFICTRKYFKLEIRVLVRVRELPFMLLNQRIIRICAGKRSFNMHIKSFYPRKWL